MRTDVEIAAATGVWDRTVARVRARWADVSVAATLPPTDRGTRGRPLRVVIRPGTVAARLGLVGPATSGEARTWLVVNDERGTAAGWSVVLATGPNGPAWTPLLVENRPDAITRLLPVAPIAPARMSGVVGVRTLGLLNVPVLVLQAEPGTGAGSYLQPMVIAYPAVPAGFRDTIQIQLPSASQRASVRERCHILGDALNDNWEYGPNAMVIVVRKAERGACVLERR